MMIEIRSMHLQDIAEVMRIQALCYAGDIPESMHSLQAKYVASPSTCFVAVLEAQVQAYLFALPWLRSAPPVLNSTTCVLPAQADCLYLHDLAVAPSAREHGTGRALVQAFFHVLQERGLEYACLVAVQDSGNYWRRYGFQTMELNSFLQEKLSTYGSGAEFMQLTI